VPTESQARKRGHAEALMTLIARVTRVGSLRCLDRIAVTTGPAALPAAGRASPPRGHRAAANKPVVGLTTLTAYAAPVVSQNAEQPVISAEFDARHEPVYFKVSEATAVVDPDARRADRGGARDRVRRAATG